MDICPFRVSVRMNSQITRDNEKCHERKKREKKRKKEIRWNIKTRVHLSRKFIRQPAYVSIFPPFLWKNWNKEACSIHNRAKKSNISCFLNNGEEGSALRVHPWIFDQVESILRGNIQPPSFSLRMVLFV